MLVFVVGLLADRHAVRAAGEGRDPDLILAATVLAIIVEAIGNFGATGTGSDNPSGWGLNVPKLPDQWFDDPDFGTLGEFSLLGSFEKIGVVSAVLLVFTLMLADFFDTMGTMTAIGAEAGLLDEDGIPPNTQRILVVDSRRRRRRWRGAASQQHVVHRVRVGRR